MKRALLCIALTAGLAAAAHAQNELDELLKKQDTQAAIAPTPTAGMGWHQYINARFGFVLYYPPELIASPAPANGSGAEYHTAAKDFSLAARSQYLGTADLNDSLDKRWQDELTALGSTVTYKRKTDTWYVISGTKNGTEYYHKFFTQGKNWTEFSLTYPHADTRKYDPWVVEIGKRFIPFLDGPFDRIK